MQTSMVRRLLEALSLPLLFSVAAVGVSGNAIGAFTPRLDEFYVLKNSVEVFRDSFDDGGVPPSGPNGSATYGGSGHAGFTGESGGMLTVTPSHAASFQITGLYELSSLPSTPLEQFGIGLTDRTTTNTGNDIVRVRLGRSNMSGALGVIFTETDFVAGTTQTVDFSSIENLLPAAAKIELTLFKNAASDAVNARYIVFDAANALLGGLVMDGINNVTNNPVTIFNGEDFTRTEFFALAPVPEPQTYAMMLVGLGLVGWQLRRAGRPRDA